MTSFGRRRKFALCMISALKGGGVSDLGRALSHTAAIIAGDQLGAVGGLNQD
jgi:hypothetical protein